jgi:hypothetical protein
MRLALPAEKKIIFLLLLLAPLAAHAWEPTDAASIDARVQALNAAWAGKDAASVGNDKLQRARQATKPGWVSRLAFRVDDGPRHLYLGVGSAKLPTGAQLSPLQDALPPPPDATLLDWYLDETTGTLYALALEKKR